MDKWDREKEAMQPGSCKGGLSTAGFQPTLRMGSHWRTEEFQIIRCPVRNFAALIRTAQEISSMGRGLMAIRLKAYRN